MRAGKVKMLARVIAQAVRNSELENLHAGMSPSSKTGDYSDVKVVSPYGEIAWNNLSRFDDEEMRVLMLDIEENILGTLMFLHEKKIIKTCDYEKEVIIHSWDNKKLKGPYWPTVKQTLFGKHGISWDIPKGEWNKLLKLHEKIRKEKHELNSTVDSK